MIIKGWTESGKEVVENFNKENPTAYLSPDDRAISIQCNGWAIVLLEDGSYFLEDTSGG